MNNTYKLVWNSVLQAWVVASELAKSHKKSKAKLLSAASVLAGALLGSTGVWAVPAVDALPTGEVINAGNATFDRNVTNQLTVTQSTGKLITNWSSFNVGSDATVNFVQPDASSIALNRVTGPAAVTEIFGHINANGQIAIVNPSGIVFGATSQVNAAAITASVFSITDANFNNDNYQYVRLGTNANVENNGSLNALSGDVNLLAPNIKNTGSIKATGGNVNLLTAQDITLSNTLDPVINQASSNYGLMRSSGSIQATQVSNTGGRILLVGDTSLSYNSIELSGKLLADDRITATGKDIDITSNLSTTGDISLTAADNIAVKAVFDVGNNNALNLNYGSDAGETYKLGSGAKINLNGAAAAFSVNGNSYTVVHNVNQLQDILGNLSGNYVLASDIDAAITSTWNSGAGFAPIGSTNNPAFWFSGKMDGLGHTVKSLFINRPTTAFVGLFGYAGNSTIQNIGVLNPNISGGQNVGGLVGSHLSTYANTPALIDNSYVSGGSISGSIDVGGLVGLNFGVDGGNATIRNSYASTTVSASSQRAGGLVGQNYAIGGLGAILNSYSGGSVFAPYNVGGLVGLSYSNNGSTLISNSYSTAQLNSQLGVVGGLVGTLYDGGGGATVTGSYATGAISSVGSELGGLIGYNANGVLSNSYWDSDTTGIGSSVGASSTGTLDNVFAVSGHGGADPSAYAQASYANFDFGSNWFMAEGNTRPMLRAFLNTADNTNVIAVNNLYQLQGMNTDISFPTTYVLTQNIDASATLDSVNAAALGNYSDVWGGKGFSPIGTFNTKAQNSLEGLNHIISNLNINRPDLSAVGLFGGAVFSQIRNVGLSNVSVSGNQYVGTLVGYGIDVHVDNSFAIGNLTATGTFSGGLLGLNDSTTGSINNSYASVNLNNFHFTGGLIGYNRGIISNSYANGTIANTGFSGVGGLVGLDSGGVVTNSYWDTEKAGVNVSAGGGTGISTADSKQQATYSGWNIDDQAGTGTTWRIYEGYAAPILRSFLTQLTVSGGEDKTYDGTTYSGGYTTSDVNADRSNILGSGSYSGNGIGARNAGSYVIGVEGFYSNQQGYDLSFQTGSLNIAKASLNLSTTDVSKTYDGTTTVSGGQAVVVNGTQLFDTDTVTGGDFSYLTKHAGAGNKAVSTANVTVNDGNGGNNYDVTYVDNSSSTINKALLTLSSTDVVKTYDGTTAANGTAVLAGGSQLFDNDSLSGGTFTFDNKNAGSGKTVDVSNVTVNDGNNGDNYAVTYVDNSNSSINKASLLISSTDVVKTYDGTTAANGTAVLAGGSQLFDNDSLSDGSYSFSNKNAGSGKTVDVSNVTVNDGNNGDNYTVSYTANTNSTINKASLVLSTNDISKTYDGTTTATGGQAVAVNGTQLFDTDTATGGDFAYLNKHAGIGNKVVSASNITVNDGNNGDNYTVSYADNITSTISKASLLLSSSDVSKTYDGTLSAAGTATALSTLYDNDSVSGGNFSFDNKNAGSGKHVITSNVTVNDGNNGDNYDVTYADNSNSSISKASLVLSSTDVVKTYDGTTAANGSAVVTGGTQLFDTDGISGGTFSFANKNAGASKTVSASNVSVNDGNNGDNYNVSYTDNTNSTINKASLVLSTTNISKTYDGSTTASGGNAVAVSGTQLFADDTASGGDFAYLSKHAGAANKAVSVANVTVNDGNSGNNYNVSYANNTTSTINKASLQMTAANVSKTYDGTRNASGSLLTANGSQLFGTDNATGGTYLFDNKNAGTGKTVTVSGVSINDGNNGGNYNVSYVANTNSSISKANLVISSSNISKTYDGTITATGLAVASNGTQVFAGDNLTGGTFKFDNKNTGTGKTVTVSAVTVNDGNSGNNYNVSYANNLAGTISKAILFLQADNVNRVYDGTTDANTTIRVVAGSLFGADAYTGGKVAFLNKNAGTNKQLALIETVSLADGNNGNNYLVAFVPNQTSTITAAPLTIQAVADSKVYDGKVNSAGQPELSGLIGSDRVTGLWQQFADKNAGPAKTINIKSGYVVDDGNSGNNYAVTTVSNTAGVISPASLILTAVTDSKVYDGGLKSVGKPLVSGILTGDRVTGLFQQFADKNAGENKALVIKSGYVIDDGNGGNNYVVSKVADSTGVITPKLLTINAVASSKAYDGGVTSTGKPVISGLVTGDRVTGLFQTYENKLVGTGKRLYIKNGYVVQDGNAGGNYSVVVNENHAGVITAH